MSECHIPGAPWLSERATSFSPRRCGSQAKCPQPARRGKPHLGRLRAGLAPQKGCNLLGAAGSISKAEGRMQNAEVGGRTGAAGGRDGRKKWGKTTESPRSPFERAHSRVLGKVGRDASPRRPPTRECAQTRPFSLVTTAYPPHSASSISPIYLHSTSVVPPLYLSSTCVVPKYTIRRYYGGTTEI
jgi:hypothetical protein